MPTKVMRKIERARETFLTLGHKISYALKMLHHNSIFFYSTTFWRNKSDAQGSSNIASP